MNLQELLYKVSFVKIIGTTNVEVVDITFDSRKMNKAITIVAQHGSFTRYNTDLFLELSNGSLLEETNKTRYFSKFSKYKIYLYAICMNDSASKKDINEYLISELFFKEDFPRKNLLRYRAYGHFRLLWPLVIFSTCLPTIILLSANFENGRRSNIIGIIIMLCSKIFFMIFYLSSWNFFFCRMFVQGKSMLMLGVLFIPKCLTVKVVLNQILL